MAMSVTLTQPPALFHVTASNIMSPSWEAARDHLFRQGEVENRHPNGILGLWASTEPESYRGLGPFVMELRLRPDFVPVVFDYGQLAAIGRDLRKQWLDYKAELDVYVRLRERLMCCGDVLFCEDNSGMAEVIVLNYDAIERLELRQDYAWRDSPRRVAVPHDWRRLPGTGLAKAVTVESVLAAAVIPAQCTSSTPGRSARLP